MRKLNKKRGNLNPDIVNDYYKDCSELPLWNFIKCTVSKNLNYLIISGTPDVELMKKSWNDITNEYSDLSDDGTTSYILNLFSQISYLDEKLRIVYNIIAFIENRRSEELIKILQEDLGFGYSYSEETIEDDLRATVSEIKIDKVNLDLSEIELKAYKEKSVEPNEVDYVKLIVRLGKHQGYPIKQKETTVLEFVAILNDFSSKISNRQLTIEENA